MTVHLSVIGNAFQFLGTNGRPLSAGKLYTYAAGTSTPQTTYTDSLGAVPNANPIVLGADGRVPFEIWLTDGVAYKFVLQTSAGATIGTYDNLTGIGDPALASLLAASSGSSLVGFLQAGAGAVTRTVQSKLRDTVSVKDFGATGGGVTDDTAAIQAALSSGAGAIYFPAGTYVTGTLVVPSNVMLYGDGRTASVLKAKSALNAPVLRLANNSNIRLESFGVDGNYASQSSGDASGITSDGATSVDVIGVRVQNTQDWGFAFYQVTGATFIDCEAPTIKGGANSSAVRAGFLLGASAGGVRFANDVAIANCFAGGANAFTDGFVTELGSDVRVIGCRAAVSYTGFKIKTDRTMVEGCYATGGVQGFQTQQGQRYVSFIGNIAYRCGDSGFYITNADTVNPFYGLVLKGNIAIENGQAPASSSYGFAFELAASCTLSEVVIEGNIAVDHQGVPTQARGISFGASGTVSQVILSGNLCKGNTVDILMGASLQLSSLTMWGNRQTSSSGGGAFSQPGTLGMASLSWSGTGATSTGLAINAGSGGQNYMLLISGQSSSGNSTCSALYMIRSGYDANNFSSTKVSGDDGGMGVGSSTFTFTQVAGILQVAAPNAGSYLMGVYTNR